MRAQVQVRSSTVIPAYSDQVRHQPSRPSQPNQFRFQSHSSSMTAGNSNHAVNVGNQSADSNK